MSQHVTTIPLWGGEGGGDLTITYIKIRWIHAMMIAMCWCYSIVCMVCLFLIGMVAVHEKVGVDKVRYKGEKKEINISSHKTHLSCLFLVANSSNDSSSAPPHTFSPWLSWITTQAPLPQASFVSIGVYAWDYICHSRLKKERHLDKVYFGHQGPGQTECPASNALTKQYSILDVMPYTLKPS